jgi:hypothetical protein
METINSATRIGFQVANRPYLGRISHRDPGLEYLKADPLIRRAARHRQEGLVN